MSSAEQKFQRVIAIDGPAASGKSSVARELARRLGFVYVNSGALYRAITWHVLDQSVPTTDTQRIVQLLDKIRLQCDLGNNQSRVSINDLDLSEHLRDVHVNSEVSRVSSFKPVRDVVDQQLHRCARENDVVVEGRDIGSVVFPTTPYKFYVDATPEVRALRRAAEGLLDQIAARDQADSSREAAPLVIARDAEVIDSSQLTIDQVVDEIIGRLKAKGLTVG
jgi:cytidylate kinase